MSDFYVLNPLFRTGWSCQTLSVSMLDDIKNTLWATADKLRANMGSPRFQCNK